jgi:hypothetical protein
MPQDVLYSNAHLNNNGFIGQAYDQVKYMLKENVPPREILARLATAAEVLAGTGASASILVLDEEGLLRNGASPSQPSFRLSPSH